MDCVVHVELLEEGSPAVLKVPARQLENDVYLLGKPENFDPEDTILKFLPGAVVRCIIEKFGDGSEGLMAVEQIKWPR
jgi:hypothetical protein